MTFDAIIAVSTPDGWRGIPHHHDTDPAKLGPALWALYHQTFEQDLSQMIATLLVEHPGGWYSIVSGTAAPYERADFARVEAEADPHVPGIPACYCHCHDGIPARTVACTCKADPAMCDFRTRRAIADWVYVLDRHALWVEAVQWWHVRDRVRHDAIYRASWGAHEPNWAKIASRRHPYPATGH